MALMRHVNQSGGMPPDGRVTFTIYGLLRLMGKNPKAGKNIENVRNSIDRISTTDVYAENAFYNSEGEIFESQRFCGGAYSPGFRSGGTSRPPSRRRSPEGGCARTQVARESSEAA